MMSKRMTLVNYRKVKAELNGVNPETAGMR